MLNDPMVQRGLYAVGLPVAAAVLVAGVAALVAWRGKGCRRFGAWVVPLAGAIGLVLAFVQPFHPTPEPGAIGGEWVRWKWLLPAMLAVLLLWPGALMLWPEARGKRWFWGAWTAIVLAIAGGVMIGFTRYDMQSSHYLYVVPVALAILGVLLYPPATRDAETSDLFAVLLPGLVSLPILMLLEFHSVAVLATPAVAAAGVATIFAVILRGERFAELRQGLAAGAMVVPLTLPLTAMVGWFNASVGPVYGLALLLLPVAAVVGVWASRLPRVMPAIVATILAIVALGLVLTQVDLSPYIGTTQGLEDGEAEDAVSSEYDYWSSGATSE